MIIKNQNLITGKKPARFNTITKLCTKSIRTATMQLTNKQHLVANKLRLIQLTSLFILILASFIQSSSASGIFEIKFSRLVDSYGSDLRKDCCNWQNQTTIPQHQQHSPISSASNQHNNIPSTAQQQTCDPTTCQLIIRICVKNYQTQITDSSQCTFGELTAQVMKTNEPFQISQYPSFYQNQQQSQVNKPPANRLQNIQQATRSIGQSPTTINYHHQRMLLQQQQQHPKFNNQNGAPAAFFASGQPRALRTIAFHEPITFPFNFTWPGIFSLVIDAWYESPTGLQQVALPFATIHHRQHQPRHPQHAATTTYDLYKKQLIIKHSMHSWLSVKDEWTNDIHRTDAATLAYSYRVTCQQNYFGEKCNILCRPRDDVYGHYTCSQEGAVVCLPGWQGSYCSEPICAPGCQGNCSRPNECTCRPGWAGPSCEQCVRHPRCVHGTCNKPFECNCEPGWRGVYCNEEIDVCMRRQPCKNGGTCTDSRGPDSYKCTCPDGFAGKDCERRMAPVIQPKYGVNSTRVDEPNQRLKKLFSDHHKTHSKIQPILQDSLDYDFEHPFPMLRAVQQERPQLIDRLVVCAYGIIIVCMVILVAVLLLRKFDSSNLRSSWSREGNHAEDVATLQNHQNIYKSRTSLSADKNMQYDSVDSGCSSSASTSSDSIYDAHDRSATHRSQRRHHSHHNLHMTSNTTTSTGPLNPPPPPYTISHSHPNSTYNNSAYYNSIYNLPAAISTGALTGIANGSIYGISNSPYRPTTTAAFSSPYGTINPATYQSPYYVIYRLQPNNTASSNTATSNDAPEPPAGPRKNG